MMDLLKSLTFSSVVSIFLYFLIAQFTALSEFSIFFWVCLASFSAFNANIFLMGYLSTKTGSNNSFFGVVSFSFLSKLIMSIALVYWYKTNYEPENNIFIVSFFICYLSFTIFETVSMLKQAQSK